MKMYILLMHAKGTNCLSVTEGNQINSSINADRKNGALRGKVSFVLLGVLLIAAVSAGIYGYWYYFMKGIVYTDDARFAGHMVDIAPELNGRISEITVREGETVKKGQPIFTLDPTLQEAAVKQAEAALMAAEAEMQLSRAKLERVVNGNRTEEVLAAEATFKRLEGEEKLAKLEMERSSQLRTQDMASQSVLDRARFAYESARQNRENFAQNLSILKQGSRKEDVAAARAQLELSRSNVMQAASSLEKAKVDLSHCRVSAPFDGVIVRRWLQPGAMPVVGQPVVSIFDPASLRVDANIEEKYLSQVAVGDDVSIDVDSYPDLHLKGRVTDILRATNSQFSLIPAEGVSGTYIKVAQRIPLRIGVEAPPGNTLAPGLSVEVRVHVGKKAPAAPTGKRP